MSVDESRWLDRRLSPERTVPRTVFHCVFGLAAPLLCLWFDPIVFRSGSFGEAALGDYDCGCTFAIYLGMLVLAVQLATARLGAFGAGLLFGGFAFSAILGLVLLPFSLIGLMAFIGVFGFVPFLTAFAYLRNAVRAFAAARQTHSLLRVRLSAAAGFAVSLAGPVAFHTYAKAEIAAAVARIADGDPGAVDRLHLFRPFTAFHEFTEASGKHYDEDRGGRLAAAYQELTGESLAVAVSRTK